MRRKKSLGLTISVYVIIALLLFSVLGVVVVYVNGIQLRNAQYQALQAPIVQPQAAPIEIVPLEENEEEANENEEDTADIPSENNEGATITISNGTVSGAIIE